jgi:hypothetical protein
VPKGLSQDAVGAGQDLEGSDLTAVSAAAICVQELGDLAKNAPTIGPVKIDASGAQPIVSIEGGRSHVVDGSNGVPIFVTEPYGALVVRLGGGDRTCEIVKAINDAIPGVDGSPDGQVGELSRLTVVAMSHNLPELARAMGGADRVLSARVSGTASDSSYVVVTGADSKVRATLTIREITENPFSVDEAVTWSATVDVASSPED